MKIFNVRWLAARATFMVALGAGLTAQAAQVDYEAIAFGESADVMMDAGTTIHVVRGTDGHMLMQIYDVTFGGERPIFMGPVTMSRLPGSDRLMLTATSDSKNFSISLGREFMVQEATNVRGHSERLILQPIDRFATEEGFAELVAVAEANDADRCDAALRDGTVSRSRGTDDVVAIVRSIGVMDAGVSADVHRDSSGQLHMTVYQMSFTGAHRFLEGPATVRREGGTERVVLETTVGTRKFALTVGQEAVTQKVEDAHGSSWTVFAKLVGRFATAEGFAELSASASPSTDHAVVSAARKIWSRLRQRFGSH